MQSLVFNLLPQMTLYEKTTLVKNNKTFLFQKAETYNHGYS